jgi:hypothetical protein
MQVFWSLTAIASLFAIVFIATRWPDEQPDGACRSGGLRPADDLLNVASASEHRSHAIAREFQRERRCPPTGRSSGACPGYRSTAFAGVEFVVGWRSHTGEVLSVYRYDADIEKLMEFLSQKHD